MSIHKFKTAMVIELAVEFEYSPAEPGGLYSPPEQEDLGIISVKAILPDYGSAEWKDMTEECWGHIEKMKRDAADEAADRGDYEYERIRDERIIFGGE